MLNTIADIYEIALAHQSPPRLALAAAQDKYSLDAVVELRLRGYIEPILIGNESQIRAIAQMDALDLANIEIIEESDRHKAIKTATKMVHDGDADILMKGSVNTSELLHGVLNKDWGLRGEGLLSHIALFETDTYHKLLALTDVAMNIAPDLHRKIDILKNGVNCLNRLGIAQPKVAILGAVEKVDENMQATLDAALISKMQQRGQIENCLVDGPLALDNVVSRESAMHKGLKSEVAGDTDLLLLPNIETGNVLYKALVFFAKAKLAAVILGATAPVVLTSRSDSMESKMNSIMLAAALAGTT